MKCLTLIFMNKKLEKGKTPRILTVKFLPGYVCFPASALLFFEATFYCSWHCISVKAVPAVLRVSEVCAMKSDGWSHGTIWRAAAASLLWAKVALMARAGCPLHPPTLRVGLSSTAWAGSWRLRPFPRSTLPWFGVCCLASGITLWLDSNTNSSCLAQLRQNLQIYTEDNISLIF